MIIWSHRDSFCISVLHFHYDDVIMGLMASQVISLTIVYSTVCSCTDQRKHQSSASLAFVREIHRGPVNFPHKGPVTREMFPCDHVCMIKGVWVHKLNRVTILVALMMIQILQSGHTLTYVTTAELQSHMPNNDMTFSKVRKISAYFLCVKSDLSPQCGFPRVQ